MLDLELIRSRYDDMPTSTLLQEVFLNSDYRAYQNLHDAGLPVRSTPSWAVKSWFIPVVSLWEPYRITKELWRYSPPDRPVVRSSGLVVIWWVAWIMGPAARLAVQVGDPNPFTQLVVDLIAYLTVTVAGALFVIIVRQIALDQRERSVASSP